MLRYVSILLVCIMLISIIPANAVQERIALITPQLSFSGKTANCIADVNCFGKYITLTVELKHNGSVVDSWYTSGTSLVQINETCSVTRGQTYVLVARGTIGDESFSESITRTCP